MFCHALERKNTHTFTDTHSGSYGNNKLTSLGNDIQSHLNDELKMMFNKQYIYIYACGSPGNGILSFTEQLIFIIITMK